MISKYAVLVNCTLKTHKNWIILVVATVLQFCKQKKSDIKTKILRNFV